MSPFRALPSRIALLLGLFVGAVHAADSSAPISWRDQPLPLALAERSNAPLVVADWRTWLGTQSRLPLNVTLRVPTVDTASLDDAQWSIWLDGLEREAQGLLDELPEQGVDVTPRTTDSPRLGLRVDLAGLETLLMSPRVAALGFGDHPDLTRLAAGAAHNLYVQGDGQLWAWGANDHGQLGDGTNTDRASPVHVFDDVTAVAAGDVYSLALKSDGSLWAWGANDHGQLGDGTHVDQATPVNVLNDITAIAAGANHALALDTQGQLWGWGVNAQGQIGDGSTEARPRPVRVLANVVAMAGGGAHTLALKPDGTLWTWGANDRGQLGDGSTTNRTLPMRVMTDVLALSAGRRHSLALTSDGRLWTWGANERGQLGSGSTQDEITPIQVLSDVTAAAAGANHSLALTSDNRLWAWGANDHGQVGGGATIDFWTPNAILSDVTASGAGSEGSMAITADGRLWLWGANDRGQLGDGTHKDRHTPAAWNENGSFSRWLVEHTPHIGSVNTRVGSLGCDPIPNGGGLYYPCISQAERSILVAMGFRAPSSPEDWCYMTGGGQTGEKYIQCTIEMIEPDQHTRVQKINFDSSDLTGSITGLGNLKKLTEFSLGDNQLTGTLPVNLHELDLERFSVALNQLDGSIPSLKGMTNLRSFNLSGNRFKDSIPSLSGLASLESFEVGANQLSGKIPSLIGLVNLRSFGVELNNLVGPIPDLAGLKNLQWFGASVNQLTGPIPSLAGLNNLVSFVAYRNKLTGPIPSLAGLSNLFQFSVNNNQLTGSLPDLTGLSSLANFDVSNNQLSGPMPLPPTGLSAGTVHFCNNFLETTGSAEDDAAWDVLAGLTPVNGVPGWLACQRTDGLKVSRKGKGTVTSSPAGINCGDDCREIYPDGSLVTLTATPNDSHSFRGWGGDCTGAAKNCKLTIAGPQNVVATFSSEKNNGEPPCPIASAGNPINTATGNKFQAETDFIAAEKTHLALRRYYNSLGTSGSAFGSHWHSTWHRGLGISSDNVTVTRADGRQDIFTRKGSAWVADPDVTSRLSGNAQDGWILTTADDIQERYGSDGRLLSLTDRAGLTTSLIYDASSRLTTVYGPFGHALYFKYTAEGKVSHMTTPDGKVYAYAYDAQDNLVSVTYPDAKVRRYIYENKAFPHALTGIIDERGNRYATFAYDGLGRAILTEHAGGADRTTVAYDSDDSATVTDPRGHVHGFKFTNQFDLIKPMAVSGAPVQTCGGKALSYDNNGFLASRTDFNGNSTNYTHNARGLETQRVEAAGTAKARTIRTTWHPSFRLPTRIVEPNRTTSFSYDNRGNLLTKSISSAGKTRTWRYTYDDASQLITIDGPRTDVEDITRFTYDAKFNLASETNALGQVTRYTGYDGSGRPLSITDPNGLVTKLTYDARGRLKTRTQGTETTTLTYDAVGNLIKVTSPDGSFMSYSYDAAHRLTEMKDALGNRQIYTLDKAGNRIKEQTLTAAGKVMRTHTSTYDQVNRLLKTIGAGGETTAYVYDENGNLTQTTDPLGAVTRHDYDALNRLIETLDPNAGTTAYDYDANDHLTSVTDPRNLKTAYAWDGLDNALAVTSPDTGKTARTYDAAGNLLSSTDARGKKTHYAWDALNRKIKETFADGTAMTWQYDQGTNGIGHLTRLTDPAGTTAWTYDRHGRVLTRKQTTGTVTLTTRYGYDAFGRLGSLTYPSGKTLTFSYDAAGQLRDMTAGGAALLSQVVYQPFGFASAWKQGNGATYRRTLDQNGRITNIDSGGTHPTSVGLDYDAASRIAAMTETGLAGKDFAYDALGQLTRYSIGKNATALTYDANGNRLQSRATAGTTVYTYPATSNRLTQRSGLIKETNQYDPAGNLTSDGKRAYTYNARGRLAQVKVGSVTTTYGINGLGQRVSKRGAGGLAVFVYDESGHLLGEYDGAGRVLKETVWLDDTPVAVLTGTGGKAAAYYVNANHLNAPRSITNQNGKPVWTWDPLAFGDNPPNQNPAGLGKFVYNLRFPGQYFDAETGLHYNYFRDYNPSLGRYVQSDPIGLNGGINTYSYANNDPNRFTDRSGLRSCEKDCDFMLGLAFLLPISKGVMAAKLAGELLPLQKSLGLCVLSADDLASLLLNAWGGNYSTCKVLCDSPQAMRDLWQFGRSLDELAQGLGYKWRQDIRQFLDSP